MEIRRVTAGEERLWRKAVANTLALEGQQSPAATAAELAEGLADPRCYLFIAESSAGPVGLLSAYRFPDVTTGGYLVYLYDIAVNDKHRGKGVATRLIQALIACCEADGVRLVWAGTEATNTAARRAFEATGAVQEGSAYIEYEWALLRPNDGQE
jgi:GNAT superfamily N-acetyltransferase